MTRSGWLRASSPAATSPASSFSAERSKTHVNELVHDAQAQDRLLASYAKQTGMPFPEGS
ncbi:hypothetical protein MN0502_14690 [Arthrobacter sp. MN05-02]|nr:hypothetical protein MN0502_14690 [Arthrobacter sp. MN05-02]